jgi:hypothetical protein
MKPKERLPQKKEAPSSNGATKARSYPSCGTVAPGWTSARRKWRRSLALALDGVLEAEPGDLGLIEPNLVEAATEMLAAAAEIRRRLRQ